MSSAITNMACNLMYFEFSALSVENTSEISPTFSERNWYFSCSFVRDKITLKTNKRSCKMNGQHFDEKSNRQFGSECRNEFVKYEEKDARESKFDSKMRGLAKSSFCSMTFCTTNRILKLVGYLSLSMSLLSS